MTPFWKITTENTCTELYLDENLNTIAEMQKLTPEGAYTTFRTYDRYGVLNLKKHFDRLEETAALAGKPIRLDRAGLKKALCQMIDANSTGESRIRVTVDLTNELGDLYLALEPLEVPAAEAYAKGVDVSTTPMSRSNPKAKLNKFIAQAAEVKRQKGAEMEEILMVDDRKEILEGLSSNFYAVMRGEIFTAEEGVLSGTTRDYVLRLAKKIGVPVNLQAVSILEMKYFDEAFLTSTSRSILPVRRIDKQTIGKATPGAVTKKLMQAFAAELDKNLADLREP